LDIGDVVVGINETEIESWGAVSVYMATALAGSNVTIHLLGKAPVSITLAPNELNATRGYIGIYGADYWEPKPGWEWIPGGPMYAFHMSQILTWCYIILISIALFNLLPIPIFDGDKILSNGLSLYIKDEQKIKMIMWPARIISIAIVLLSVILSIVTGKGLF
jgi:membrane-associated protease RseP (regulator of RpoE activity)